MSDVRSSAEVLEGITRHLQQIGGSFTLTYVREPDTWLATLTQDGMASVYGISTKSAGQAVENCLIKADVPRIPEFNMGGHPIVTATRSAGGDAPDPSESADG